MKRILLATLFIITTASFAFADAIYLRDGRVVRGTLLGFVNGRFVMRVDVRFSTTTPPPQTTDPNIARSRTYEGEIQYFRPSDVDRIEIDGRSLDDARFELKTVPVGLEPNWVDSGIDVRRNERVQ